MTYSKFRTNPKNKGKFNSKSKGDKGKGGGGEGRQGIRKKKKKVELVFNNEARTQFLTGFHKRKLEKKAHYKTHLEKKISEEKARIRAQAKKSLGKLSSSHRILPEVEALLASSEGTKQDFSNESSYEVGSTTVTISSLDSIHPAIPEVDMNSSDDEDGSKTKDKKNGLDEDNSTEAAAGSGAEDSDGDSNLQGSMKSLLKKSTNRLLQQSKVYKSAMRLKRKGKKCKKNPHYTAKPSPAAGGSTSAKSKSSKEPKAKNNHNFRRKGQQHKGKGKGKRGK